MKNKCPIRVAQMMTEMNYGGVEMIVMNYYRHIDRTKYQFDFYVLEGSEIPQKEEIESLGGHIFIVPHYKHIFKYEKALIENFKREKYQIVHSHMNTLSVFSLFAAYVANIPVRICHNHSTAGKGETKKNIIKYILRPFAKAFPTHLCACSIYAGEWIFGKHSDFKVFNNAIKLSNFLYNPTIRKQLRKELELEDKFIIGHVGRFCYQKNHEFLVEVFKEVCKLRKDSILLLIGAGETKTFIRQKVKDLGLDKNVIFIGNKTDVYRYYQIMDCLVFPSIYEGFGMVAIEAQSAGLPVIVSSAVPCEVDITDSVKHLSLSLSSERWAREIVELSSVFNRKNTEELIRKAGFCIETEAKKLAEFYDRLLKEIVK